MVGPEPATKLQNSQVTGKMLADMKSPAQLVGYIL